MASIYIDEDEVTTLRVAVAHLKDETRAQERAVEALKYQLNRQRHRADTAEARANDLQRRLDQRTDQLIGARKAAQRVEDVLVEKVAQARTQLAEALDKLVEV